jgi:periplasmic divalent cation tolerance protein
MTQELIVFVTTPDKEEAAAIAERLVTERLAACVNIIPAIESVYRWQGNLTKDQEVFLLIKTNAACYTELEQRIQELHSYTTPEIIALKIERGSNSYLEWLNQSLARNESA